MPSTRMAYCGYSNGLGPATPAALRLNASGLVDTSLAGVRVLFDGIPAPLIYVSAKQASAVVPYSVADKRHTVVQVEYQDQKSNSLALWVGQSALGIFTKDSSGGGQGAILNQDGSVNSASNPAAKGSVVVLYATGEGQTIPAGVDGKLPSEPLPRPVNSWVALGAHQKLTTSVQLELTTPGAAPWPVSHS